jgi:hypothetical protein
MINNLVTHSGFLEIVDVIFEHMKYNFLKLLLLSLIFTSCASYNYDDDLSIKNRTIVLSTSNLELDGNNVKFWCGASHRNNEPIYRSIPELEKAASLNGIVLPKHGDTMFLVIPDLKHKPTANPNLILLTHPNYEPIYLDIKRTPRASALFKDIGLGLLTLGIPIIVDIHNSDFYKISNKSKSITVNFKYKESFIYDEFNKIRNSQNPEVFDIWINRYSKSVGSGNDFRGGVFELVKLATNTKDSLELYMVLSNLPKENQMAIAVLEKFIQTHQSSIYHKKALDIQSDFHRKVTLATLFTRFQENNSKNQQTTILDKIKSDFPNITKGKSDRDFIIEIIENTPNINGAVTIWDVGYMDYLRDIKKLGSLNRYSWNIRQKPLFASKTIDMNTFAFELSQLGIQDNTSFYEKLSFSNGSLFGLNSLFKGNFPYFSIDFKADGTKIISYYYTIIDEMNKGVSIWAREECKKGTLGSRIFILPDNSEYGYEYYTGGGVVRNSQIERCNAIIALAKSRIASPTSIADFDNAISELEQGLIYFKSFPKSHNDIGESNSSCKVGNPTSNSTYESNPDIRTLCKAINAGCLPPKDKVVISSKQPTSKLWNTNEGRVGFKFISADNKIIYYYSDMQWVSQSREVSHDEYQSSLGKLKKETAVLYERGTWACEDLTSLPGASSVFASTPGVLDNYTVQLADFNGDLTKALSSVNSQKDKYISEEPIRLAQEKKEAMRQEAIRVAKEKEAIQWMADIIARSRQYDKSNNSNYSPSNSPSNNSNSSCTACNGSGKLICQHCNGSQNVMCYVCKGRGGYEINGNYRSCGGCGADGYSSCNKCNSGYNSCRSCNGSGKIR